MSTNETLHDKAFALVSSEPPSQPEDSQQGSGSGKPFLEVDAEHRYKTREEAADAIKGTTQRIEELSSLQEHLKQYGLEKPEDFDAVVDEYLTRLEERQKSEGASALSEQDRVALAYLKQLGLLTKDDVQAREQVQHAEEARTRDDGIIESARNDLRTLLKDAGRVEEDSQFAEPWIRDWIQGQSLDSRGRIKPGSLLDRFWQGGEETKKVIAEAFAVWRKGIQAMTGSTTQSTPLPSTTRGQNPGGTPSELHDRAFALLQTTPPKRRGIR